MPLYIKFKDLEGALEGARTGWSEVDSVSHGVVNHGADSANQQQRTMQFDPITVTRSTSDHLTPQLMRMVAEASTIPEVVIETTSGDANPKLMRRITFTNALVRLIKPVDSATVNETLEIGGAKIKFEFAHPVTGVMASVTWNNKEQRFEG